MVSRKKRKKKPEYCSNVVLQMDEQPAAPFFAADEVSDPAQCCEGMAQSRSFGAAMKTTADIKIILNNLSWMNWFF
jgi:hypothetical protein